MDPAYTLNYLNQSVSENSFKDYSNEAAQKVLESYHPGSWLIQSSEIESGKSTAYIKNVEGKIEQLGLSRDDTIATAISKVSQVVIGNVLITPENERVRLDLIENSKQNLPKAKSKLEISDLFLSSISEKEVCTIPSGYKHFNIEQQISNYRRAYQLAFPEGYPDKGLEQIHVPRLYPILKNAYALANDYIQKGLDPEKVSTKKLEIDWKIAQDLNESKKINSLNFCKRIGAIARILDQYQRPEKFFTPVDVLPIQGVIFVLISNPDPNTRARHPSLRHFVDQYLHKDFPASIAELDICIKSYKIGSNGSKKNIHFSEFDCISQHLRHEFDHDHLIKIRELSLDYPGYPLHFIKDPAITFNKNEYFKAMKNFYEIYKKKDPSSNEAMVLLDNLFVIFHELYRAKKPTNMANMISKLEEDVLRNAEGFGSKYYKLLYRDWEIFLEKTHDEDGKYFLPLIKKGEVERPHPFAFNPETKEIFVLKSQEELDSHPELQLFDKTWQKNVALDHPELKSKREEEMIKTLQNGYSRFFNYFRKLAEI